MCPSTGDKRAQAKGRCGAAAKLVCSVQEVLMSAAIVNHRIAGTRITVWDVYHYLEGGDWTPEQVTEVLPVTLEQVHAAMQYIEANKEYVLEVHRQIEERNARGNPPEVEAKVEETRKKMQAWLEERRRAKAEELPKDRSRQQVEGSRNGAPVVEFKEGENEGNPGRR
jgi:uncharacterized protein (DUF433 family)